MNTEHEFKIRDVVIERTQNHTMTVYEVAPEAVVCQWFSGSELEGWTLNNEAFNPANLVLVRH